MEQTLEFRRVVEALLQNALDLAQQEAVHAIDLEISADLVRIGDDGPGLPMQPHPFSGRPLLEVIMTGARREAMNTLARLNASCLWLDVEIHRDGELWFQRYEFARPTAPPKQRGTAVRQGTTISCAPARGEPPTFEQLRAMVRRLTQDTPGVKVKVRIRDAREAQDETIVIA